MQQTKDIESYKQVHMYLELSIPEYIMVIKAESVKIQENWR